MTKENSFKEIFVEDEVKQILKAIESELNESYVDEDILPDDIWERNTMQVADLPTFFRVLQDDNIIPTDLTLHITTDATDISYEQTSARFILFDGIKPIYTDWFDELFRPGSKSYEGIEKGPLSNLIRAALIYHHFDKDADS